MDGLIGQAKTQLWKFVNQFIPATRGGRRPLLQVALYEYGKSSLPSGEGYLRMILPFTGDLDRVSEQLFALQTNGGDEYCGQVIREATAGLNWSRDPDDLKVIFIAGNEPFTQGTVDYRESVAGAAGRGITVNTIFCGDYQEGVSTNWADGATRGGGNYMNIDQNRKVIHVTAPQDAEIERLGRSINDTYLAYGSKGGEGKARQLAQDSNAVAAAPGVMENRAVSKSSSYYSNGEWDLVDAAKKDPKKLEALKTDELPKEMQSLKPAERQAYLDKKSKERAEIQGKIQALNAEREKYVAEEMKKLSKTGDDTLDGAMSKAVKEQAKKKGYKLD
jgi:hypothetical protein